MKEYYTLKVNKIVRETDDALSISFKQPFFGKISYRSGQFLTLVIGKENLQFAITFGAMAFSTFVFDTLDVTMRLGRYLIQELIGIPGHEYPSGITATGEKSRSTAPQSQSIKGAMSA